MPTAAPIRPASLAVHPTRGAQLSFAMTLRHFVKPAFSLRKKRSVKTHALWLSATKNLHFANAPFPRFSAIVASTNHSLHRFQTHRPHLSRTVVV
jgi:hypothetical protein